MASKGKRFVLTPGNLKSLDKISNPDHDEESPIHLTRNAINKKRFIIEDSYNSKNDDINDENDDESINDIATPDAPTKENYKRAQVIQILKLK